MQEQKCVVTGIALTLQVLSWQDFRTPLHDAAYHGKIGVVEVLIQAKADLRAQTLVSRVRVHIRA